jgi:hypothetical protein
MPVVPTGVHANISAVVEKGDELSTIPGRAFFARSPVVHGEDISLPSFCYFA